ncbi:arsenite methyltransferase [Halobaculum magnesiiphilum]|uniref:Arsenite methyltransferase n=1 Tax=Halobaculum magnesiiphilum TaxID=1017351 RepID=A0A8T8W937_9EURY|nr:arsenite methyltransferase [Halobaculum magnesiiphilum]QZP36355.1 arsenite methyltransferase [Halobaculum magnesiiphilum]
MTDDDAPTADRTGLDPARQRAAVRERYGEIGEIGTGSSCCGDDADDCGTSENRPGEGGTELGYTEDDLDAVAAGANLGLGCGNPTAIASLDPGETVLDLGSGGGFDCFLAAREVGEEGRVVGVDMTPEMVERARGNVGANDATNVEFRLGEIEHLPVADGTVDVILSNCVINLSADKRRVFAEAYRVLRPGGRLAVSDVVATADLPSDIRGDAASVSACLGGAAAIPTLESMLADAGFVDVAIEPKDDSESFIREWDPDRDLADYLTAATIEARKPTNDPESATEETAA